MRGAQYPSSLLTLWLVTPKVLLQAGLDVETIGCTSLSAAVPADGILLGF